MHFSLASARGADVAVQRSTVGCTAEGSTEEATVAIGKLMGQAAR